MKRWPMKFTINRRLLRNNCLFFISTFFIVQFLHTTFFNENETNDDTRSFHSYDILSKKIAWSMSDEQTHVLFDYLIPYTYPVSCQSLYESDPDELKHALTVLSDFNRSSLKIDKTYNITRNQCSLYRSERFNESFHRQDTSVNEQFPLAFTVLMYENVEQFERLLRLIYRPQNFYCIHVDKDVSIDILHAVQSIVQCFDNVILASQQEKVRYATFSRLKADLNCMHDLLKYPSWKYLLNIANSELPLKTNSELVKILSIYRGYNDIEGRWKSKNTQRTEYVWRMIDGVANDYQGPFLTKTDEKKQPPPGNVEIVKGSAYGEFMRSSSLGVCLFVFRLDKSYIRYSRRIFTFIH
jgi:hypothetical protein